MRMSFKEWIRFSHISLRFPCSGPGGTPRESLSSPEVNRCGALG